ncbi:MAG: adenosylmethionine decarboxylase [Pseudomonadota bacterium]
MFESKPDLHPVPGQMAHRDGVEAAGVHVIVDVIDGDRLDDLPYLEKVMRECVRECRATLLHMHMHKFSPEGVSGVAVLAESHISVHTWPEKRYAAFDIFMCGHAEPEKAADILAKSFNAKETRVNVILRGENI